MLILPGIRIYTTKEINDMHNVLFINLILIRSNIENNRETKPEWFSEILRKVSAKLH